MTNTKTQDDTRPEGNTITSGFSARSRKWCLTWNNYNNEDYNTITQDFINKGYKYVIGKEVGEKNKTPHLQIYFEAKNPIEFSTLKKRYPKCHIEKAKGNINENLKYCTKEKEYSTNIEIQPSLSELYENYCIEEYKDIIWKPWQDQILNIIENKPDKRKVYWYFEEEGNTGKSFLAKYIDWKYDAIIANGKQADIFNQYRLYLEEKKKYPNVAIIDIPRSHKDYVCYSTLEKIKDGLVYSGKYEGSKLRLIPHHLIIFANFMPDISKLSYDRWQITNIKDKTQLSHG